MLASIPPGPELQPESPTHSSARQSARNSRLPNVANDPSTRAQRDASSGAERFVAPTIDRGGVALALATGLVYGATRATELTGDSLHYATAIRDGVGLVNPHHLLFGPIVHSMRFATGLDAVTAAQLHNLLSTVVALLAARRLFSILLANHGAANWSTAAIATAAGFAGYATQVEVYVPSLACTLTALALLAGHGGERPRAMRIIGAGLALALAILYYQGAVLVVLALPFVPVASRTRAEGTAVRMAVLVIGGTANVAVYGAAFAAMPANADGSFLHFCLQYAQLGRPNWGSFANVDAKGLHLLADSQLRCLVHLPGNEFTVQSYVGSVLFTAAMACVAWRLVRIGRADQRCRAALRFLAAWLMPTWAFTLWWLPREEEYLVAALPPLLGAVAMALVARPVPDAAHPAGGERRAAVPRVAWLALAAMAAWNLGTAIVPRHRDAGPDALIAAELARAADERTIVLCTYPVFGNHRLREHRGRPVLVDDPFMALYENRAPGIAIATAWRVLVPLSLIEPETRTWWFSALTDRDGWLRVVGWVCCFDPGGAGTAPSYGTLSCVDSPGGPLLRVEPGARRAGDFAALLGELDRLDPRRTSRFTRLSR